MDGCDLSELEIEHDLMLAANAVVVRYSVDPVLSSSVSHSGTDSIPSGRKLGRNPSHGRLV
jgi:hypothetical protein